MSIAIDKSMKNLCVTKHSLDVVLIHSPRCWSGHCTKEEESIPWTTGCESCACAANISECIKCLLFNIIITLNLLIFLQAGKILNYCDILV